MTAFSLIMRILILSTLHKVYQLPGYYLNSLGSGDAIWPQRSGSTLAQAMACCLRAPNHYLNQCWLIISKVEWHSSEGKFTRDTSATVLETNAGPSVWDQQLLVRTSKFLHISLQINVWISQNSAQDWQLFSLALNTAQPSITEIICKIKYLKFHSNFPGANELNGCSPRIPATWLKPHQPVTLYRGESQGDNYSHESYHKTSNISCTQSQNWNVSHLILQLSLPNLLKPGVESKMKM